MSTAPDRDLLFGMLALQNGLIDQAQLVAAFQAWTRDKARSLPEHLAARGDVDAEQRGAIAAMVGLHLKKHGGDAGRSLAAIPAGRSTRERLAAVGDPALTGTVARLGSAPTEPDGERTATYAVGTSTSEGQRFRVLRPHARGGLGAVFVALDGELHREVALKQILDGHADDPASRQRFLHEAEITGGLEHPGIVPVYGLGTYADGRPYYAMRFIRGDNLKEAIQRFHAAESFRVAPGRRSLELRRLLRRFLDVCNAIDYAHGRGVLHRDIKPGNIIVGKHGETLVVDWGLAKARGRADGREPAEERPLALGTSSGSAETLPGQALGTPAYMSPEQARGDLEALGPASDVYALGATLYCVLTGRAPFEGDADEVLRAVQRGEFRPPRQLDPTVDRALEAVCLKAMAPEPEARYATARALAEDVERWMADEPVSAYRDPVLRRAGRWARRHRTAVTVAAALLVAGAAGLAANTVLVNRQKARAEANFQLARRAVDDMYTQVAERWLAQEPQMEPLQREFLLKALAFYERFARPADASPEVRREAGKAARRVGEIQQKLGAGAAADAAFRRSRQILEGLAADPLAAQELAATANRLGWLHWTRGRSPDDAFRQALALGTVLVRRVPATPESRQELARVHSSRGLVHAAYGRFADAEASHRQALALREALVRDFPAVAAYRQDLTRSLVNLAALLRQTGRFAESDEASARAVALADALVAEAPRDPHFRSDRAHDLSERAHLIGLLGRPREAKALLLRACEEAGRLATDFPSFSEYQDLHSSCRRDLAALSGARGEVQDARRELEGLIAVAEELVRKNPDVPSYRRTLAVHRANLADLWHTAGRPADSEREYREALRLAEALAAEQPGLLDYRALRASYRSSLAFLLRATGRYVESDSAFEQVLAELDALRREFPALPQFRAGLASACHQRADVLDLLKRPRESESLRGRAIDLAEGLATEFPEVPAYRVTAAQALASLAQQSLDRGEVGAARGSNERAIRHMESVLAADPESSSNRFLLSRVTSALGRIQARGGDVRAVEASARRIEELPRSPTERYNAACFLSLILGAVRGGTSPEGERDALARSLADRAMAQLTRAIDGGYRNAGLLRKDADLDPLRPRADFQALLDRAGAEAAGER